MAEKDAKIKAAASSFNKRTYVVVDDAPKFRRPDGISTASHPNSSLSATRAMSKLDSKLHENDKSDEKKARANFSGRIVVSAAPPSNYQSNIELAIGPPPGMPSSDARRRQSQENSHAVSERSNASKTRKAVKDKVSLRHEAAGSATVPLSQHNNQPDEERGHPQALPPQSAEVAIPHATLVEPDTPKKDYDAVIVDSKQMTHAQVESNGGICRDRRVLIAIAVLCLGVVGVAVVMPLMAKSRSMPNTAFLPEEPMSSAKATNPNSVAYYLGEGECRQGNGEYPLVFTLSFADLEPWSENGNDITAAQRCLDLCTNRINKNWCFAAEVATRPIWPTPECSLVTDRVTFEEEGYILQDDSWGSEQIINRDIYRTYCHGDGNCDGTTNWEGGSINLREGYHCYFMEADEYGTPVSPKTNELPSHEQSASPMESSQSSPTSSPPILSPPDDFPTDHPTDHPTASPVPPSRPSQSSPITPVPSRAPTKGPRASPTSPPIPLPSIPTSPRFPTNSPEISCTGNPELISSNSECKGCKKDFSAGQYISCNKYSSKNNNKEDCGFGGDTENCSFDQIFPVSLNECNQFCVNESGCTHFSHNDDGTCYLHLVSICAQPNQGAGNQFFQGGNNPATGNQFFQGGNNQGSGSQFFQGANNEHFQGYQGIANQDIETDLYTPCKDT